MPRLRPVTLDDAPAVARVMTEVHPDEPEGAIELRYRWAKPNETMVVHRFVVEEGDQVAGYARAGWPSRWPENEGRFGEAELVLVPNAHDAGAYDRLLAQLSEMVVEAGAETVESGAREDDDFFIAGLERNGFRRDRLSKAWELDLVANRDRLLALRSETRAKMREKRVELKPMSEIDHADRDRLLFELDNTTTADIPHTVPFVFPTFNEWVRHMRRPSVHEDRVWTAWRDGEVVAMSYLEFPSVGRVWTGYTCCRKEQRGQGIARAVKMETLGQAIELGVDRVRTDNDEQNGPMLHINEELGYYRIPGFLSYLRP